MAYTPQTIHSHDPITADWGNKVEQHLARLGNYMGVVNTEAELPENPETGDWYMVLDKGKIYLWNGSKWIKVGGGGMARVSDTLRIDLSETFLQKSGISGTVDGSNTNFTLTDTPIWPGTITLTVDGSTTITDDGDGTLSDGGTIDYDTGAVTLASAPSSSISAEYHQKIWDGIKWYPIGVSEDFPSKIEAFVGAEATADSFEVIVRLYDENDNLLLDSMPQTVNSDGEKHTLYFVFEDFSSLTLPDTVIIQLEVRVSPDAEGYTDFIEVRWS